MISRTALALFICFGLMACGGAVTSSAPVSAPEAARSSHSSSIVLRDEPIRVIQNAPRRVSIKNDPRLGNASARIGIVEFSNYQCLYCRDFHRQDFAQIRRAFIDTGVAQFIHKDLPLRIHGQSGPAAVAAHCAGAQKRFWEMHDALYDHQGRLGSKLYLALAKKLQLNEAAFQKCLEDQGPMEGIHEDSSLARSLGFTGTPSFLLGHVEGDTLIVLRQARGVLEFKALVQAMEGMR